MPLFKKKPELVRSLNYGKPSEFKRRLDERSFILKSNHCPSCSGAVTEDQLEKTYYVCPACGHHFRLNSVERIRMIADQGSFDEFDAGVTSLNPIGFPGYEEKLEESRKRTGLPEAVVTGTCAIDGHEACIAVMDFGFMGGSMGSVVGEKIARAIALAAQKKLPMIIFTSSGGARMQEGIFSLMQMAKTSFAAAQFDRRGLPLVIVQTDPTSGGVDASFAMLGDIILAEPNALIGFAGARVIEGTLKEKLPDDFQKAEFQLKMGFVDAVVERKNLKGTLSFVIATHTKANGRA